MYFHIEKSISRVLFTIGDWYFLWIFIWWMSIYFCLYICQLGYKRKKLKICYNCWKVSWILIFFCNFFTTLPHIFLLILKSFATYGCRHPCYSLYAWSLKISSLTHFVRLSIQNCSDLVEFITLHVLYFILRVFFSYF